MIYIMPADIKPSSTSLVAKEVERQSSQRLEQLLEHLAGVEEEDGDWINIKDKKPRDGQRCLVLDDYGYMYVKPYIAKYSVFDGQLAATITHWRPLPKRPRKSVL